MHRWTRCLGGTREEIMVGLVCGGSIRRAIRVKIPWVPGCVFGKRARERKIERETVRIEMRSALSATAATCCSLYCAVAMQTISSRYADISTCFLVLPPLHLRIHPAPSHAKIRDNLLRVSKEGGRAHVTTRPLSHPTQNLWPSYPVPARDMWSKWQDETIRRH